MSEPYAALRKSVNVRRPNLRPIAAEIGEPHIIGHHDDDVGPLRRRGSSDRRDPGANCCAEKLSSIHRWLSSLSLVDFELN
jgi:hypothetical protein